MKTHIITYHILLLWLPIYVLFTVYLLSIIHSIIIFYVYCYIFFIIYYHYEYPFVIFCLKVYESMTIYDLLSIIIYYLFDYYLLSIWLLSIIYESMIICDLLNLLLLWLSTITMHN